ncbi:MerR family transcriptional regulator [soil metagenome]
MSWSVGEIAISAGVTTRTLRHYDVIGLLVADRDPVNGYRVYERSHVLRLQRILLLRSLGLSLPAIADVLAGEVDDAAALRGHLCDLEEERARLGRLIKTVNDTLAELDGGPPLNVDALFAGFAERRDRFEERMVARFGPEVRVHFRAGEQRTAGWGCAEAHEFAAAGRLLLERIARLRRDGLSPDDARVAPLVAEHRAAVAQFWEVDDHGYRALAELFVEDPDQRALVAAVDPALPPWLRDAVLAHTPDGTHGRG